MRAGRPARMRTCVRALGQPDDRRGRGQAFARLPRPGDVRRFDAPEALDIRFYEIHAKSAINRVPTASQMPFRWTINPYRGCTHACNFCFARPTHTYLGFDARGDFEREIVVKVNAPEVVRAELARPSWKGEHIAMGTNTDPYQWGEWRYRLMPGIWEAMREARNPCSMLTKSPLLLRDIEVMKQLAAASAPRQPLDPNARREDLARDRAANASPAGAAGGRRRAEPRRDPERHPDRAADARRQRLAGAGRSNPGGRRRGRRDQNRRDRAPPSRRGRDDLVRLAARPPARPGRALRAIYSRGAYATLAERRRLAGLVRSEEQAWPSRFRGRSPAVSPAAQLASAVQPRRPGEVQTRLF